MNDKYNEYKGLNLPNVAKEILEKWQNESIFEKSIALREGNPSFVFFEGPPSANGLPGIHHAMSRSIKDIFCRYKTLKGFQVKRKAGWDTHGLPVELGVEKELGITKEDIGTKISVDEYNNACKKAVMRYTDIWNDLTEKMGYWVDMENPYVTFEPKYMESVWWLLAQLYNKGLIYKGYTIQPYSPKAGTGLSSHELNQPGCYKDVKDTTVVAQFKLLSNQTLPSEFGIAAAKTACYFLAWTTTPWTLPSNTALAVGPSIQYVLVATFNQYTFEAIHVILAEKLVSYQFSKGFHAVDSISELATYKPADKSIPFYVIGTSQGKDLVGLKYEQLLPYCLPAENPERAFCVIPGDFVTTEDGTGIVHTAPTFGADDAKVAAEAGVPALLIQDEKGNLVPLVDLQGRFRPEVTDFAGMYVKNEYYDDGTAPERSADVQIAIKLKEENRAFKVEKYEHNYPHCWRTDKPVLYYPMDSWFIRVTDKKDRMVALNNTINWKPEATGTGRFGKWLENANDWNLSRSRYWGIPIPIWSTDEGDERICFGSVEELKTACEKSVKAGFISSNPFENFELGNMSKENYAKIDLHKHLVDQIILVSPSGKPMKREADLIDVWFDSGAMPYAQWHYPFENKDLIDNGTAFPADFIAEGVDQTRGWFYTLHAISTMVFDSVAYKNVVSNGLVLDKNGQKMSKRLGNAADPFTTLEKYGPDATRWYMITNAQPWDNLKFDLDGITEVQRKFFGTLYNTYSCLETVALLAAPIAPFYMDRLFLVLNLVSKRTICASVHLADFPSLNKSSIDKKLEIQMELAQQACSLVLGLRKKHSLRVRQPLQKILIPVLQKEMAEDFQHMKELILSEVNVKELELLTEGTALLVKNIKPNFKTIGPKYGKQMKDIASLVAQFSQQDITEIEKTGKWNTVIDTCEINLELEDFEISAQDIPGWLVASEGGITVALDTTLSPELKNEGIAREIVNRIQNLRKDSSFDVTDRILLKINTSEVIQTAISANKSYICDEVLANEISFEALPNSAFCTDIEAEKDTYIAIQKQ